ncbi:MAG: hypothetical protein IPG23_11185 [Burkholderiales bacterium]|nr:hypothetical protein [Burkholderiales bacterium]
MAPAIFDFPVPQLTRVLVWPKSDVNRGGNPLTVLRCLAVSADRRFAAQIDEIYFDVDFTDPLRFWRRLTEQLEHKRARFILREDEWSLRSPPDCFSTWSNTATWLDGLRDYPIHPWARVLAKQSVGCTGFSAKEMMAAEAQVQCHLEQQFASGIRHVVNSLVPDIAALMSERPQLRMSVVERFFSLAKQAVHPEVVRFAMQALRTEALALLDLAVAAPEGPEGATVLAAILQGSSLPLALQSLGISKGAHRRTIRGAMPGPCNGLRGNGLSEVPLSGRNWLVVLALLRHLPFERWPRTRGEWGEFITTVALFHEEPLGRTVMEQLLRWCSACRFLDCGMRIALLMDEVQALTLAAHHLYNWNLCLEDAYRIALCMAPIVESLAG